jgi:hypothetical protein
LNINILRLKKAMISIFAVVFVLIAVSCSPSNKNQNVDSNDNNESNNNDLVPEITDVVKQTAFDKDIIYLNEKGINLPKLPPNSPVTTETFLSLLVETYEAIGGAIDISNVNPRSVFSDDVKKMTKIGVYENYFMVDNTLDADLDYGTAAYWLMKLQDSVQNRLYWRSDATATVGDLLRRINVSNALHTWTQETEEVKTYTLEELIEVDTTLDQPLTRLLAAEMLVSAYEDIHGEIKMEEATQFSDTDSIYAMKSNQLFFWPETDKFEPEKLGRWDEWSFTSAIIYDSQIRLSLKLEEIKVPYGAVTAAMASFIRVYDDMEQNKIEELIVLNERPYDWYVSQLETGEYSYNNCMPSCVEMAMRYQGLSQVPSAENLRSDNLLDGLGWTDAVAENAMKQYGLQFTDSFDIKLDIMLDYLDKGNVLYVMYWDPNIEVGHSVIIKGYWKLGERVDFILSDPYHNMYGPFGYLETTMEADTMMLNMESHVPRYFIIPVGE